MPLKQQKKPNLFWKYFKKYPGLFILSLFFLPLIVKIIGAINNEISIKQLNKNQ